MRMIASKRGRKQPDSSLEGQLLIAMPTMSDRRFARSVILMCAHSAEGAMGLIINQRNNHITFPSLLKQLEIIEADDDETVAPSVLSMSVHVGGPVKTGSGFVLHSADYKAAGSTISIDGAGGVSLTATIDILRAMADGHGPDRALVALGYAGWSAGQLESEIAANGWLHCPADADLVFDPELELKYDRALSKLGVELSHLVAACGHA